MAKPDHKLPNGLPLSIETEAEIDGRWVAEIPRVPGGSCCGNTEQEAAIEAFAIALQQEPPSPA